MTKKSKGLSKSAWRSGAVRASVKKSKAKPKSKAKAKRKKKSWRESYANSDHDLAYLED